MWKEADRNQDNDVILIGVGNPLRGDDGAGREILRRLKSCLRRDRVAFAECSGDGADLMSTWEGYGRVYFFDAVMNQGKPGRVHRWDANEQAIPSDYFRYSSHAFSLAEAIEMGKVLDRLPGAAIIYGVEGLSFEHGERLTEPVLDGIDQVVTRVRQEVTGYALA